MSGIPPPIAPLPGTAKPPLQPPPPMTAPPPVAIPPPIAVPPPAAVPPPLAKPPPVAALPPNAVPLPFAVPAPIPVPSPVDTPVAGESVTEEPAAEEPPAEEEDEGPPLTPEELAAKKDEERKVKQRFAANEILDTERSYVDRLEKLIEKYLKVLAVIALEEQLNDEATMLQSAASALSLVLPINQNFLSELETRCGDNWHANQIVGDIFLKYAPLFRNYSKFVSEQDKVGQAMDDAREKSERFNVVVAAIRAEVNLNVDNLLRDPTARLPRYPMLLEALLKRTPKEHPDHDQLERAIELVEGVAHGVDEAYQKQEKSSLFTQLINAFHESQGLIVAHRKLLKEDTVSMKGQKFLQLLLCNDILIAFPTHKTKASTCINNALYSWPLSAVWISRRDEGETFGINLQGPFVLYELEFETNRERDEWFKAISEAAVSSIERDCPGVRGVDDVSTPRNIPKYLKFPSGIETIPDGDIKVKGDMLHGQLDGKGQFGFFSHKYRGDFQNNVKHGEGEFICITKDKYEGHMVANVASGTGKMTFYNGDTYDGEWLNGVPHGQGIFTSKTGLSYEGEWEAGCPHGSGTLIDHHKTKFSGQFSAGRINGNGTLTSVSGENYVGSFKDGLREGAGIMTWHHGDTYNGGWKGDKRDGRGIYQGMVGKYEGDFKEDNFHGKGVMKYKNGNCYNGEWKYGLFHGKGTYEFASGEKFSNSMVREITGHWSNGHLEGACKIYFVGENGIFLKGNFKDDMPSGAVTLNIPTGKIQTHWNDGVRDLKKTTCCSKISTEADVEQAMLTTAQRSFGFPIDIVDFAFV